MTLESIFPFLFTKVLQHDFLNFNKVVLVYKPNQIISTVLSQYEIEKLNLNN